MNFILFCIKITDIIKFDEQMPETVTIQRADLDGSNVETLLTGLSGPEFIAIDETNYKIYWTDDGDNKIRRANTDGSSVEVLLPVNNWMPAWRYTANQSNREEAENFLKAVEQVLDWISHNT